MYIRMYMYIYICIWPTKPLKAFGALGGKQFFADRSGAPSCLASVAPSRGLPRFDIAVSMNLGSFSWVSL